MLLLVKSLVKNWKKKNGFYKLTYEDNNHVFFYPKISFHERAYFSPWKIQFGNSEAIEFTSALSFY